MARVTIIRLNNFRFMTVSNNQGHVQWAKIFISKSAGKAQPFWEQYINVIRSEEFWTVKHAVINLFIIQKQLNSSSLHA